MKTNYTYEEIVKLSKLEDEVDEMKAFLAIHIMNQWDKGKDNHKPDKYQINVWGIKPTKEGFKVSYSIQNSHSIIDGDYENFISKRELGMK